MIRLVKWEKEDFRIGELLPSTFCAILGNSSFIIDRYEGGITINVTLTKNAMYEIDCFSTKKRPDLVHFGASDAKYIEIGR